MLFTSLMFIGIFLPITFAVYFGLNRARLAQAGKVWLVAASLFFYSYWNIAYLPLILGSMVVNFGIGSGLGQRSRRPVLISRRQLLGLGIVANLALLGYFKYTDFFLGNLNSLLHTSYTLPGIILPLGISFFTFTQIAYLVDAYRGEASEYDFVSYALFVTFFPHLIAGPVLHHREIMPQFASRWTLCIRYRHILSGLFLFSLGLFKKVVLADSLALWANEGFDQLTKLDFFTAWSTSLSYTFQLYFDFSGYCDMAMGTALMFNIVLPLNFNSPYQALNIQNFWQRWHMTLSRFLRDYLYIPLGGNRVGPTRLYFNLMATFVLGGLWHGASWMFVLWGALHGAALVLHRLWQKAGGRLPSVLAWLITFNFINLTWVVFRAKTPADAIKVLHGMLDLKSAWNLAIADIPTQRLAWSGPLGDRLLALLPHGVVANLFPLLAIALAFYLCAQKNAWQLTLEGVSLRKTLAAVLLFSSALLVSVSATSTIFLYFNF